MSTIFNRLQFVHHNEVFATREEAYAYVMNNQTVERPSLFAEPMVLLYESGDAAKGPNVILAIGSVGEGEISTANRTFFIDLAKTEQEIKELGDSFAEAIQALVYLPLETSTAKMNAEATESGTNLSVDVKVAPYKIIDREVKDNIIQVLDDGLYAFLGIDFDEATGKLKFTVNDNVTEYNLPTTKNVVGGEYDTETESVVLNLADGSTVSVDMRKMLEEWKVLGESSSTPVILTRTKVDAIQQAHGMFDWQDVLEGDIRVASHIPDNIAQKDSTGRYLYVKGTAENIKYKDGTVKDALDKADIGLSTSVENIIYARPDGLFATAQLDYNSATNTLVFKYSNGETQNTVTKEIKLNSLDIFEDVSYDATKEAIIIRYQHDAGQYKTVEIPVGQLITEWEVQNDSHTVSLYRNRNVQGADTLSADAKISNLENNILEEKAHELYVGGIASNIKYDPINSPDDTVKDVLDYALTSAQTLGQMIEYEAAERTNADNQIHGRLNVVDLAYQPETNRLYFTDTYGNTKEIQLVNKVSIIDDITYDKVEKDLVIKYKDSETGEYEYVRFGISELFNEWDVKNLPEGSAIELTKTTNPGTGENDYDVLTARVLLTNLDDNLVGIVNNGLYVSAAEVVEKVKPYINELMNPMQDEIDRIEAATGLDENGNFVPFSGTNYIDSANTFAEVVEVLDDEIKKAHDAIDNIDFSEIFAEIDSIENGAGLNEDGTYTAKEDGCFISGATSLFNADELLDNGLCELKQVVKDNELATAAALNDLNNKKLDASAYTPTDLTGYATEDWVDGQNYVKVIELNGTELETSDHKVSINLPVDTELSSSSTNPVENRVITQTIIDNELVTAAALNDLNDKKLDASAYTPTDLTGYATEDWVYNQNFVNSVIVNGNPAEITDNKVSIEIPIAIDVDDALDSGSTNPVQNKVISNRLHEIELTAAAAINDLNTRIIETNANVDALQTEVESLLDCGEYQDGDVVAPNHANRWS